ncbi:MAG: hypothetical protein AAI946_00890 [Candidatus Hodgkinia cicadicola]
MITTIITYVAIQQTIDYLVTSYMRLMRRKQRIQRAREALKHVPKVRIINTAEDVAKRKALEAEKKRRKRARAKAKAAPQTVRTNLQALVSLNSVAACYVAKLAAQTLELNGASSV